MTPSESTKHSKRDPGDEVICSVSLELPFDPVTEREEIEKYFKGKTTSQIRSPSTNTAIGRRLTAAPPTRNTIETLIENGVITGDRAEKWEAKEKQKNVMDELR